MSCLRIFVFLVANVCRLPKRSLTTFNLALASRGVFDHFANSLDLVAQ